MKKLIALLLLAGIITTNSFAQKIILCNGLTKSGEPLGNVMQPKIGYDNVTHKVVFQSSGKITAEKLTIDILKSNETDYVASSSSEMKIDSTKNFASWDWEISEAGDYKVVVNAGTSEQARMYVTVESGSSDETYSEGDYNYDEGDYSDEGDEVNSDYDHYTDPTSTFYYIDSKVTFASGVNSDKSPVGDGITEIKYKKGVKVWVCVDNDYKNIKSDGLSVHVMKKSNGDSYDEKVEDLTFNLSSDDNRYAAFEYTFKSAGDYNFRVYTKDEIWINDGYFSLTGK